MKKKKFNSFKQWWFYAAILIIVISVFTPQVLSYIYPKQGWWWTITDFEKEDLLQFYGSFLAFLGTVVLGALALHQNFKANEINKNVLNLTEESERRAVLPYISINTYMPKYSGNLLLSLMNKAFDKENQKSEPEFFPLGNDLKRKDILLNEIVFTVDKNRNITIKDALDEKQIESIQSTLIIEKTLEGGSAIKAPSHYYIKFNLKNVGRGSAIALQCIFSEINKEKNYSIPISLTPNDGVDTGVYFNVLDGNYVLEIKYNDIDMRTYRQTLELNWKDNQLEMLSNPLQEIITQSLDNKENKND